MIATALSDAELLSATREGDEAAFTELYSRHQAAALRLATSYRRAADPDDLVNGAFERVLAAIRRGSGPTESFRAYLFVTLRRLATELIDRDMTDPYDEVPEAVAAVDGHTPIMEAAERAIVLQAYESLPDRWQAVLWQTTVEGKNPKDLAPILGMSANAAAALAYRAREKLRQAYLQAHLQAAPHPECEPYRSQLGAYVRDGLSARDHGKVEAHLDGCGSCRELRTELLGINNMLNQAFLPYFLGAAEIGAVAVGAGAAAGPLGLARKGVSKARNNPGPTAVAAVVAAALVAGLIAANSPGGEDPPDAAAGPVEEGAPPAPDEPAPDDPADPEPEPQPDEPAPEEPAPQPSEEPDVAADQPASPDAPPDDPTVTDATDPPPGSEPAPTDPPPGSEPAPADPAPTDPPVTDPPAPSPTDPPEPDGQVVWNAGTQSVVVTLHNPGPTDTGLVAMQLSVTGGAVMSGVPSGCAGVALLVLTECVVTAIPPGQTAVISQPVAGTGPGTYATVGCTLGAIGLACDSVMPSSTVEMN